MSIASELTRIQTAKADIKTAIEAKGVTVPSSATIDTYDDYITSIPSGGGGSSADTEALKGMIQRNITSLVIPNGVTVIGSCAFRNCGSLTAVTISSGVIRLDSESFRDCTSLTSVIIPSSVTSIGNSAFESCTSLTSITIPNSVTSIGANAINDTPFYNDMNDGLVYLGVCLYGYKGDKFELTDLSISAGTQIICNEAFRDCHSLTSLTIPNSVTTISSWAFGNCSSLTSITIPDSVTEIGENSFFNNNLTSVTIGNGCEYIYNEAFSQNYSLESVTIGSGVTSIGGYAFGNALLHSFTIYATTPPEFNDAFFGVDDSNLTIYVPSGSVSAYQNADGWSDYSHCIQAIP